MSHTPGPWDVEKFSMVVSHERRQRIADVGGGDAQERAENARLIAAAPDLLAALKFFAKCMSHGAKSRGLSDSLGLAKAAIAKAEVR